MLPKDLTAAESEATAKQSAAGLPRSDGERGRESGSLQQRAECCRHRVLRQALGYDQINLYGISYGTRLALTAERDAPRALRSVVIDSVYHAASRSLFADSRQRRARL